MLGAKWPIVTGYADHRQRPVVSFDLFEGREPPRTFSRRALNSALTATLGSVTLPTLS
jgi:hypothetical protein